MNEMESKPWPAIMDDRNVLPITHKLGLLGCLPPEVLLYHILRFIPPKDLFTNVQSTSQIFQKMVWKSVRNSHIYHEELVVCNSKLNTLQGIKNYFSQVSREELYGDDPDEYPDDAEFVNYKLFPNRKRFSDSTCPFPLFRRLCEEGAVDLENCGIRLIEYFILYFEASSLSEHSVECLEVLFTLTQLYPFPIEQPDLKIHESFFHRSYIRHYPRLMYFYLSNGHKFRIPSIVESDYYLRTKNRTRDIARGGELSTFIEHYPILRVTQDIFEEYIFFVSDRPCYCCDAAIFDESFLRKFLDLYIPFFTFRKKKDKKKNKKKNKKKGTCKKNQQQKIIENNEVMSPTSIPKSPTSIISSPIISIDDSSIPNHNNNDSSSSSSFIPPPRSLSPSFTYNNNNKHFSNPFPPVPRKKVLSPGKSRRRRMRKKVFITQKNIEKLIGMGPPRNNFLNQSKVILQIIRFITEFGIVKTSSNDENIWDERYIHYCSEEEVNRILQDLRLQSNQSKENDQKHDEKFSIMPTFSTPNDYNRRRRGRNELLLEEEEDKKYFEIIEQESFFFSTGFLKNERRRKVVQPIDLNKFYKHNRTKVIRRDNASRTRKKKKKEKQKKRKEEEESNSSSDDDDSKNEKKDEDLSKYYFTGTYKKSKKRKHTSKYYQQPSTINISKSRSSHQNRKRWHSFPGKRMGQKMKRKIKKLEKKKKRRSLSKNRFNRKDENINNSDREELEEDHLEGGGLKEKNKFDLDEIINSLLEKTL